MATNDTAVALREQGLSNQVATDQNTPGSVPAIVTADQTAIAQPNQAQVATKDKDPFELRQQLATVKVDLTKVTTERDELAARLEKVKEPLAKIETLGGMQYIERCVGAIDFYNEIAVLPTDPAGKLTIQHYKQAEKFVDAIHDITPEGGDRMEVIMNDHYGARAWDVFQKRFFGSDKPSNEVIAASDWGVQYYRTYGKLPDMNQVATSGNGNKLPDYFYYADGTEIPEVAAAWRAQQAEIQKLKNEIQSVKDTQASEATSKRKTEEQTRASLQEQRRSEYRTRAFEPIETAIRTAIPDHSTNPQVKYLRTYLEGIAEREAGDTLRNAIRNAEAGNIVRANSALPGIQGLIQVAIAEALPVWQRMQNNGKEPTQEQISKAQQGDGGSAANASGEEIPFRPERDEFATEYEYLNAVQRHAESYRGKFKTREEYLKATTKTSAA